MFIVELKPLAFKDLSALPQKDQERIRDRLDALSNGDTRDVKKLVSFQPPHRLRVGAYRILLEMSGNRVTVYRIKHRSQAYR